VKKFFIMATGRIQAFYIRVSTVVCTYAKYVDLT
jgi:hypothetical protein